MSESSRAPKRRSTINVAERFVEVENKIYLLAPLPSEIITVLALRGLRTLIVNSDDPSADFDALMEGSLPVRERVSSADANKREAYALYVADYNAQKRKIGKKHPEYPALLNEARGLAATIDAAGLRKVMKIGEVVMHYDRLRGFMHAPIGLERESVDEAAVDEAA